MLSATITATHGGQGCGVTIRASWLSQVGLLAGWTNLGRATTPPNKELKLTKPSIMELRSLTPVFGGLLVERRDAADLTSDSR